MSRSKKNGRNNPKKVPAYKAVGSATAKLASPAPKAGPRPPFMRVVNTMESKPQTPAPTAQAVAEAAYYLWLKRGGNDLLNWLEAEAQLSRQLNSAPRR